MMLKSDGIDPNTSCTVYVTCRFTFLRKFIEMYGASVVLFCYSFLCGYYLGVALGKLTDINDGQTVFSPEFAGRRAQIILHDHAPHLECSDC